MIQPICRRACVHESGIVAQSVSAATSAMTVAIGTDVPFAALRCGVSVCYLRDFSRVNGVLGRRTFDPKQKFI